MIKRYTNLWLLTLHFLTVSTALNKTQSTNSDQRKIARWSAFILDSLPDTCRNGHCSLFTSSLKSVRKWTSTPHHTTTFLQSFFRDHLDELVPEENFWTLWCKED